MLIEKLAALHNCEVERVGFVLANDEIIEVENVSTDPKNSFAISSTDHKYCDLAEATWHTHPVSDNAPSGVDYAAFLSWSHIKHYIIGTDGVACYAVEDGVLVHG